MYSIDNSEKPINKIIKIGIGEFCFVDFAKNPDVAFELPLVDCIGVVIRSEEDESKVLICHLNIANLILCSQDFFKKQIETRIKTVFASNEKFSIKMFGGCLLQDKFISRVEESFKEALTSRGIALETNFSYNKEKHSAHSKEEMLLIVFVLPKYNALMKNFDPIKEIEIVISTCGYTLERKKKLVEGTKNIRIPFEKTTFEICEKPELTKEVQKKIVVDLLNKLYDRRDRKESSAVAEDKFNNFLKKTFWAHLSVGKEHQRGENIPTYEMLTNPQKFPHLLKLEEQEGFYTSVHYTKDYLDRMKVVKERNEEEKKLSEIFDIEKEMLQKMLINKVVGANTNSG